MKAIRWKNLSQSLRGIPFVPTCPCRPNPRDETRRLYRQLAQGAEGDKRAIFSAAAHAQRAADYLHSLQPQPPEGKEAA